jgi:hypothetical protein
VVYGNGQWGETAVFGNGDGQCVVDVVIDQHQDLIWSGSSSGTAAASFLQIKQNQTNQTKCVERNFHPSRTKM